MKIEKILETVTKTFSEVKIGGRKSDPKLAALDRGVLTVGLYLSALDGEMLPEEYEAIRTLAQKCRGGSAKNVRVLLDAALPAAGHLMSMAKAGIYSEADRLKAFLAAAERALPNGFADGSLADLRRAFVLWVSVGVADGDFSQIERTALESLSWSFAAVRVRKGARKGVDGTFRLLELDFLEKAEKLVRDLASPTRRAKAEAGLESLIAKIQSADGSGDAAVEASETRLDTLDLNLVF